MNKGFNRHEIAGKIFWILTGSVALWAGFPNNFICVPFLVLGWPLCIIICAQKASSSGSSFRQGWLISFLGSCAALYWLSYPLIDVGNLHPFLAQVCAFFIAAILSFQGGLFGWIAYVIKNFPVPVYIALLSLTWYLLEFFFAWLFGFPWLSLSGALAPYPLLLQHANIFGAWLASALWLIPFLFILFFFKTKKLVYAIKFSLTFTIIFLYCFISFSDNQYESSPEMQAIFIEGNINQNQKWLPSFQQYNLDIYIALSKKALETARKQNIFQPLLIWPETAMPFFYEKNLSLANQLKAAVKKFNSPLLFGAPGLVKDANDEEVYNRAFLLDPEAHLLGHYDKMHLVPFGEYLPEWLNISFLSSLLQGVGIYKSGQNPYPLIYNDLALGMLICYEGIFPWLAEERIANKANILVDLSNDGWFGLSPAAKQHLYLTVPRSIEQNRWLLRATNTGISAVIDNKGRIVRRGELFTRNYIPVKGKLIEKRSFYSALSQYIPWIVLLLTFILIYIGVFINIRGRKINYASFK